jgi:peptidoglycan/LPS O-acetylase OafA/YrhL
MRLLVAASKATRDVTCDHSLGKRLHYTPVTAKTTTLGLSSFKGNSALGSLDFVCPTGARSVRYRPDIDGLRACAVLPVVAFHAGLPVYGGFTGVDVFFVISGYVITGRLLEDLEAKQFSIITFYERRIRRIFPALIFIMLLTTIAAWFLLLQPEMIDYSKSLVASVLFSSNFYFWYQSGYFDIASSLRPLLHLWSLAVEEQFYLFAPIAMYLVYKLGKRWRLFFWPVLIASFSLSVVLTKFMPSLNFYFLPTRGWELLLGALILLTPLPRPSRGAAEAAATVGAILMAMSFFSITQATPFPGLNALFPCLGAALTIYAGTTKVPVFNRLLSLKPIVWIGLISYSLYLTHWPIFVMSRYYLVRRPQGAEVAVLIVFAFILAIVSYNYVEAPFRTKTIVKEKRWLFLQGTAAMLFIFAIGLLGSDRGYPARFPDFKQIDIPGGADWQPGTCFLLGSQSVNQWNIDKCTLSHGHKDTLILWGDSFGAHYVPGLIQNSAVIPYNIVQMTSAGCPPVFDYVSFRIPHCQAFNKLVSDTIDKLQAKEVILSSRWDLLQSRGFDGLRNAIDELKKRNIKTVIIGPSPEFGLDVQSLAFRLKNRTSWSIGNYDPQMLPKLSTAKANELIDPISSLCDHAVCPYIDNGQFLYLDYGHFSSIGSGLAVKQLRLGIN